MMKILTFFCYISFFLEVFEVVWAALTTFFCTRTIAHNVMINMTVYFCLWRVCFDSLPRRGLNISQHSLDKCCEMTVVRWISLPALLSRDILNHVTVLQVRLFRRKNLKTVHDVNIVLFPSVFITVFCSDIFSFLRADRLLEKWLM